MATVSLDIRGYRDQAVPHRLLRQERGQHLAILLPGLNYSADRPLLSFAWTLLEELGADVLRLDTAYGQRADFLAGDAEERERWLLADATSVVGAAMAARPYRRLTLVGKSLGTLAMGHLLTSDATLATAEAIWLTPLLKEPRLCQQLTQLQQPGLFAVGSADPLHDPGLLASLLTRPSVRSVVIEGGDHSLEIVGDTVRSVQALEQVVRAMQAFLSASTPTSAG